MRKRRKHGKPAEDAFDPSTFGDPVAEQTGWFPVEAGGFNYRTRRLVRVSPSRIEFRGTAASLLAACFCLVLGLVFTFMAFKVLAALIFGAVGILGGCYSVYDFSKSFVFDRDSGLFWFGHADRNGLPRNRSSRYCGWLDDIHALQVLREYVPGRGRQHSYLSYELNLVLQDARRMNVIDHHAPKALHEEATTLARFLGVPVWDASLPKVPRRRGRGFARDRVRLEVPGRVPGQNSVTGQPPRA